MCGGCSQPTGQPALCAIPLAPDEQPGSGASPSGTRAIVTTVSTDGPPSRKGRGRPDPRPDRAWTIAGEITLADGQHVAVTTHCVDRFWERAAGGCANFKSALARLQQLAEQIGVDAPAPDWAGEARCDRYIALGDDIGLLIVNTRAVTCIARGSISDAARDWRNQRRPSRRRDGRTRSPRPHPPPPETDDGTER
jgi:hypothetical protein